MALEFGNRIAVGTSTTGTGTVTLGSAVSDAFMTFAEGGITDGATVHYLITEGNDFEIGTGTYTLSGTTLSRDTVTDSKISGTAGTSKMNLGGSAEVRVIADASDFGGGGGAQVILATYSFSGDAAMNFTAFDSGTYDAYIIYLFNVRPADDNRNLQFRTSTDGGSSYDSTVGDYKYAFVSVSDSGTRGSISNNSQTLIETADNVGAAAGEDGVSGTVIIHAPHLAKQTLIEFHLGWMNAGAQFKSLNGFGIRTSSADVDGFSMFFSSGNIGSGEAIVVGVKNST